MRAGMLSAAYNAAMAGGVTGLVLGWGGELCTPLSLRSNCELQPHMHNAYAQGLPVWQDTRSDHSGILPHLCAVKLDSFAFQVAQQRRCRAPLALRPSRS